MNVAVKITGVPAAQRMLTATERKIAIAQSRAIRGTLSWVRVRVRRSAAKKLKVPQKALQSRLLTSRIKNGETSGKLWAGVWNISPFAVGKPRQGKSGVVGVPGRRYIGAFIGKVYSNIEDRIWIRVKSKHFNPELYHGSSKQSGRSVPEKLKHRHPLARASIEIQPTMAEVFDRDEGEIRREFDKRLRREINYAMNIESGRFQHSGVGGSFSFPER